jgi:hypothetical protein
MKARRLSRTSPLARYAVGDILLAADRAASAGAVVLTVRGGGAEDAPASSLLDVVKPKAEDYSALTKTLQALKLSPQDVADYHAAIGSVINLAAGAMWGVGAVLSVASFIGGLLGKEEDAVAAKLEHISRRADQIYGYLAARERRGLHDEAAAWRADLAVARRAVQNARASRSPENLDTLKNLATLADRNLLLMLDPGKAEIAFLRAVYGYRPTGGIGGHWVDGAVSPYMNLAAGGPINYGDPDQELQATIWDAGHYIDVLLSAISDRLLVAATLEPAYRTTGLGLGSIKDIADGLSAFLNRWRASFLVADPLAGLNEGGELLHPATDAPPGIVIGAVDPVSGVAACEVFWADFTLLSIYHGSLRAKGKPDETRAKDPASARAAALDLQPRLLDGVVRASGIQKFVELRARLLEIVTRSTVGSDFVDLPNASFNRTSLTGPAAAAPVDLGVIGQYSKNPGKLYATQRYEQGCEKTFRFAMPLRGEISLIQPGYRMELGRERIEVIPFSNAPADGGVPPRFPVEPIALEVHGEDWTVYDVYQSEVFSEAEEDRFEGAEPTASFGEFGRRTRPEWQAGLQTRPTPDFLDAIRVDRARPERLFLNERSGYAALSVDIRFDADLDSPDYPFVGHATVTIRTIDPERFRDGLILPVTVYETGIDPEGNRAEWVADRMTIHLVPGFFTVDPGYFADRREGLAVMDEMFESINERYARYQRELVPLGPEWQVRRRYQVEQAKLAALDRFVQDGGEDALRIIRRYQLPPQM